jgi:hypothetical protein
MQEIQGRNDGELKTPSQPPYILVRMQRNRLIFSKKFEIKL